MCCTSDSTTGVTCIDGQPFLVQVSSGHLARQCKLCGGELKCTQPADVFRKQLTVFKNIARYHSFQLLMEIVEWLLEEPGVHQ